MKIVGVLGSPHGMHGATGKLLDALLEAVRQSGAEVEMFSLAELQVGPCRGCDNCHKTGACALNDDFETVKSAMLAADGIVLASPNYISSVSAQMKALFDRCCGPLHIQAMEGKYGAAVVTGGAETRVVEEYALDFLRRLGCWTVGSVGALARELGDDAKRDRALRAAADLGRKFVQAIESRQTFPDQVEERAAFRERMRQLVLSRKDEWPYEYEYWTNRGGSARPARA